MPPDNILTTGVVMARQAIILLVFIIFFTGCGSSSSDRRDPDTTTPTISVSAPDNTYDTTPTLTGYSDQPNTTVTLIVTDADGNSQTLTATTDAEGYYSIDITSPLPKGTYSVTASIYDSTGNAATATDSGNIVITFIDTLATKRIVTGINSSEGIPFVTEENQTVWIDIVDILDDIDIEETLKTKRIKNYNPFAFYYLREVLKNSDFLTLWITSKWDESWFDTNKLQAYLDGGRFLVFNYWYFGDQLDDIPGDEALAIYYENVQKVSDLLSKLHGNILFVFEPEFNKEFLTSDEEKAKRFAEIIARAIDIIKSQNPNVLISLCMMDRGNRGVDQTWERCGFEMCASGDRYEWEKSDLIYRYIVDKLDFLSFEEVVGQFQRDSANPANPIAYTPENIGIDYLDQRILNLTTYLHDRYGKPVLLDYIGIASAVWEDNNGDGKIQDDEIDKDGWNGYVAKVYKNLRAQREALVANGLFGYAPMMLIDHPQHDRTGWQFFLQNEYHLGLIKTSAKGGVDLAPYGDMVAKGEDLLEDIFAPDKAKYLTLLDQTMTQCLNEGYNNCNYIQRKLDFYIDKSAFPTENKRTKAQLIPLYIYPDFYSASSSWQALIDLKNRTGERIAAIINPSDGDFETVDTNYLEAIKKLAENGIELMGYVYTKYATRDINAIKQNIDNWNRFYKLAGIRGIFFDEASMDIEDIDFYIELTNYATSKGFLFNALNPGTNADDAYFQSDIANIIVSYENRVDTLDTFIDMNTPTIFTKKALILYDTNESHIDDLNNYIIDHRFDYYYFE